MSTYVSAVPLAMVRTTDGGYRNVFEGEPIEGESVEPENLERMLRKGFLVEATDPEDSDDADGPPAKSAKKEVWEAYARSQGATDEDLEGKSKDDLIEAYSAA